MKKALSLILVLAMVLCLFSACGGNATSGNEEPTGTAPVQQVEVDEQGRTVVKVGIGANPSSLAPFEGMSMAGIATRRSIYEFLVDKASFGGEMVGIMMKDWEKVDDTTYNCYLYDYIYDTEGNHLTAQDVVFSYSTAMSIGNLSKLSAIESVTAPETYTVQFKFVQTLGLGELETLWSECPIVTQAAYEASADNMTQNPVGTTAYRVISYIPGSSLTLEKTDSYWQTDASKLGKYSGSNIDVIKFVVITESSQMSVALETGLIDISASIAANDVHNFVGKEGYSTSEYIENTMYGLYPNCAEGNIMSNKALREAVFYAIDADALITGVFNGQGIRAYANASEIYGDYNPEWKNRDYFEYNLETAKAKMAEAGYPDGGITVRLLTPNSEEVTKTATVIKAMLSQIGIDLQINAYETAMYNELSKNKEDWDLIISTAASSDYLISVWRMMLWDENYAWGGTMNFIFDDELQAKLDEAATVDGHTMENMNWIDNWLNEGAYAYGLFNEINFIAHTNAIETVALDFRNQIMPGNCTYTGYGETVDVDDFIKENEEEAANAAETEAVEEPAEEEPAKGPIVEGDPVGVYTYEESPMPGLTIPWTLELKADGTWTATELAPPNGEEKIYSGDSWTYENGLLVTSPINEEEGPKSGWFVEEEGFVGYWVLYQDGTFEGSEPPAIVEGDPVGVYTYEESPMPGLTIPWTLELKADGTWTATELAPPNGEEKIYSGNSWTYENGVLVTGPINEAEGPMAGWFNAEEGYTASWILYKDGTFEGVVSE